MLNSPGLVFILSTLFTFSRQTAAAQQSIHLTNPSQKHFKFAYNAMDQCFKKEISQRKINSFSLKFKFESKCAKGLLICYPGALDINGTRFIYGMMPAIQFRIKNIPGNDVAKKCAEKQKAECKKIDKEDRMLCTRGISWHGLRVSKPINTANQFLLELSITNQTYTFDLGTREFSIGFGNRYSLLTHLLDQSGDRIKLLHGKEDGAICNAYLERKVQKEVHLSNYVGLWMLGLDFLPMNVRETMHMHAYRDCACEMHAWFTRPNDGPIYTNAFALKTPYKCATTAQNDKLVVNAEHVKTKAVAVNSVIMLRVKFRVNKKPKTVTLRLEDKNKYFILEMTISGQEIQLISGLEQDEKEFNLAISGLPKNSTFLEPRKDRYMQVLFDVHEFYYEIKINGVEPTRFFPWPNDWWARANQTLGISLVWLSGDLYPDSAETDLLNVAKRAKSEFQSNKAKFQPLTVGDRVIFRGQVNKDAKSIMFYMTHNSYKINPYIGIAVLKIQFNFTAAGKANTLEACYQTWNHTTGTNQFKKFKETQIIKYLQRGAPFELRLTVISRAAKKKTNSKFFFYNPGITVTVDTMIDGANKHIVVGEFHLQAGHPINNIGSEGDMNMFTEPEIKLAPRVLQTEDSNFFLHMLGTLLAVGDSALFEGCLYDDATELRIFFLHNMVEPRINESNIPLGIIFKFHKVHNQNFMTLHFNATKENGGKSQAWTNPSRLFAGEDFKIEIKVKQDGFEIYIHGAFVQSFEHQFPPWAVNFFRIDGNFKKPLKRVRQIRGPAVISDLSHFDKFPIVYKVPSEKKFSLGNIIFIHSMLENATENVFNVSLLYEALETYETVAYSVQNASLKRIGGVVLHAKFTRSHVQLFERINTDRMVLLNETELPCPIVPEKLFGLRIAFEEKIELRLNNNSLFNVSTTLPLWAIEYVRVDGENLVKRETNITLNNFVL